MKLAVAGVIAVCAMTPYQLAQASAANDRGLGETTIHSDFDGDGFPDLAIGAPGGDGGRGTVTVLYGSASGLSAVDSTLWTLATSGVAVTGKAGDQFGFSVTAGHFDADRFADLAIGVPGRNAVVILYGSPHGLDAKRSQLLHVVGPLGGYALAAADFNNDGVTDLAVGDPFAWAGKNTAGKVEIEYGSANGFTTLARGSAPHFAEGSSGMPGFGPGINDHFGFAVAGGDYNGDGVADLAVGIPGVNYGVGATIALYGSSAGVTTTHAQYMPAWGGAGGAALASGDFNRDGFTDLAVGEPNGGTSFGSGMVEIHYGSAAGLLRVALGASQLFAQETLGMPGPQVQEDDRFGFSLTAADFNGDGYADLAIGVPGQSAVIVLRGSSTHIHVHGAQYVAGIGPHVGGPFSSTRLTVAAGDFRRSGFADLVVGEPFADTSQPFAGLVELHMGSLNGVTSLVQGTAPVLSGDTTGMAGGPSTQGELFGASLTGGGSLM